MSVHQYTKDALPSLSGAIVDKAPYFGSLPLPADAFELFFKDKSEQAHSVNLARATEEQLRSLAEACSVAPFGRGAESVLDDTYRKAGKLDLPNFAIPFHPEGTALSTGIRECVLEGAECKRPIRFELDKLNVYGEGGFFKAHKDTPRGGAMFGSLVLVYPTVHSGGALVFRHRGHEWTFDSASSVYQHGAPAFGYAAFYSDVEHEVLPVTSGYRVTITYNMHFNDAELAAQPTTNRPIASDSSNLTKQLRRLLDDPQFMPQGGYLGFGLHHSYPIEFNERFRPVERDVQPIMDVLKGSDASVRRAARNVGLPTQLRFAYDVEIFHGDGEGAVTVLTTRLLGGDYVDEGVWMLLRDSYSGVTLWPEGDDKHRVEREVHWVTPRTGATRVKSVLVSYGNSPDLEFQYSDLCLLVAVGPVGARLTKENLEQDTEDMYYNPYSR